MLEWKLKPPVSMAIKSGQNIIKAEKLTLLISQKTSKQSPNLVDLWHSSRVVSVLDSGAEGSKFKSQP